MSIFFSLNIVFLLVGSSFFVVFVGGDLCVFIHLLHSSLVLFILGVLSPWEFLWRAGSYVSFCVGLRCVECRAGTIYLSASLGWVVGLYRFSSFGLCCGGYGTIEMVGGWSDFLCRLQFAVCSLGRWLSVVGLPFPDNKFPLILVLFVGLVFYKLLIFVLIRYRWWRKDTDQEGYEPLLEQTQLEHCKVDLESRIEDYEAEVRALKDNHVMLEDGEKKDAVFSEICNLDCQIIQLKSELATVVSLLSAYD
jgi:hypothetical protein